MVLRKSKAAEILRTRKYISIVSYEIWKGLYFSRVGHVAFEARQNATSEWIGEHLRLALETSQYFNREGPLTPEELLPAVAQSNTRCAAYWTEVADTFGFKDFLEARKKSAMVFVSLYHEENDLIILKASRGKGLEHSAWPTNQNAGKVFEVSINAPVEEIGETAIATLDQCRPNFA